MDMSKTIVVSVAATLFAVAMISHASVASATPVSDALAIKNAAPSNLETVRGRGGGRGGGWGRGRGWGVGGGFAAGAILGGLLAAPTIIRARTIPAPATERAKRRRDRGFESRRLTTW